MEQPNETNFINRDKLIYWIDKDFVQETAQTRIGRKLSDEEISQLTKLVEFGLWDAVFDTIKIAIDEVTENELEDFTKMVESGLWHPAYDVIQSAIDEINKG